MTKPALMILLLSAGLVSCGQAPSEHDAEPAEGWELEGTPTNYGERPSSQEGADDVRNAANSTYMPEATTSPFATCETSTAWTSWNERFWYEPALFAFTPNDGLIVRSESLGATLSAYRSHDGLELNGLGFGAAAAVDDAWMTGVTGAGTTADLEVRAVATGDLLSAKAPPAEGSWGSTTISPDGARVAGVSCVYEPEGGVRATLHVFSATGEATLRRADLDTDECMAWSGARIKLAFSRDGSAVFVGLPRAGRLLRIGVDSSSVTEVDAHTPTEIEEGWTIEQALADLAVDPRGEWVATTGADGRLRLFDARTLEAIRTTEGLGAWLINEMTYAPPIVTSPVAFSKSGDLIAWVDDTRRTIVSDRGGSIVAELPMADDSGFDEQFGMSNDPVQLAFSNDGRELAVAYYFGVALMGCETSRERRDRGLPIRFDGPESLRVGEVGVWEVTHLGQTLAAHAHHFTVNDRPHHGLRSSPRNLEWRPYEPGVHTIDVLVDDGVSSGEASISVTVLPAED